MRRTQRLRFRDEEEEDGETLERRVLFFREVPRHIETRTGQDHTEQQVITR